MLSAEELELRKNMSLQDKIDFSAEKIESWYDHWQGQVYVAFSGGKDSTVLLDLVRSIFPEIPAVFFDTGLEFPEIRDFVKTIPNCVMIRPKLTFRQVLEKYGYPVISKEQSRYLHDLQSSKSQKLIDLRINGDKNGSWHVAKKWFFLRDAPFKISDRCCDALKKRPAHTYDKQTGRKAFLGTSAFESRRRLQQYLRYGCNAYDTQRPTSAPLSFWVDKDIWEYIRQFKLPHSKIYDMGYERTGCMFCMYGVQQQSKPNKFQRMAITHPQLYKYCIEDLGCGAVMDFIGIDYKPEGHSA